MTSFGEELGSALFAGAASLIAVSIGWKKGFFLLPPLEEKPKHLPTLLLVFIAFGIYFALSLIIPSLFTNALLQAKSQEARVETATLAAFTLSLSILAALLLFLWTIAKPIRCSLLQREGSFEPKKDLMAAIAAWLISFPVVLLIGSLFDLLLYFFTGTFDFPDQIAVLFLKMTFDKPLYFSLAITSIVIFAPLIEETLFRGFLQSWLRRYLSPLPSIAIASLLFTSFHFSAAQGLSNLTILSSLFVLGCFLGFLYEKRQSLLAPLLLHSLFNALSAANLYLSGGS